MKKVVAVIQARIGSSRLPKKVLRKIGGKTIIELLYERLKNAKEIDDVILAIPKSTENKALQLEGRRLGLKVFQGSEVDVLSRILGAAKSVGNCAAVVRITADCPLVDPFFVDKVIRVFKKNPKKYDYLVNFIPYSFPVGMEFELIPLETIEKLLKILKTPKRRELFSYFIRDYKRDFKIYNLKYHRNVSHIRLTLDYPEDLELISIIYRTLADNKLSTSKIVKFLENNKNLLELNRKRISLDEIL